jgi:hypothetical protein
MAIIGTPYTQTKTKIQNCAAFPLVLPMFLSVVCKSVIEMKWIDV